MVLISYYINNSQVDNIEFPDKIAGNLIYKICSEHFKSDFTIAAFNKNCKRNDIENINNEYDMTTISKIFIIPNFSNARFI